MFDGGDRVDIFSNYLRYVEETESPVTFHRWSYIGSLSSLIGRKAWLPFGHGRIFPSLFIMLLGEPSSRKSTSIKILKKLMTRAGYENFAADKTRQEKFLLDLEGVDIEEIDTQLSKKGKKYDNVTAEHLWGREDSEPREVFIVADEFNEFAGPGNMDFYTTLGNLWDWDSDEPFTQRFKNSKSVSIYQPTVSILAGNTPELFARCFPPEAIGSGFLARLLLIHGERSGRRITFPPPPDQELTVSLTHYFQTILSNNIGELTKTSGATDLLDKIYQEDIQVSDVRFKYYNQRRFTQLQKLCIILAAGKFQTEVTDTDVLQAHTILCHAEIGMPKALGEFGKSKNSDVTNKIMSYMDTLVAPANIKEIWKQIHNDVSMKECFDLVQGLQQADKIQTVTLGKLSGFLPKKVVRRDPKYVDWMFLTKEERDQL
jgi:Protein of unknown function (DUF3987)